MRGRDTVSQFEGHLSGYRLQTTYRLQLAGGGSLQLARGRLVAVEEGRSGGIPAALARCERFPQVSPQNRELTRLAV